MAPSTATTADPPPEPQQQQPTAAAAAAGGGEPSSSSAEAAAAAAAAAADIALTASMVLPAAPRGFGLGQLTRHNIKSLKELNLATIPIPYKEDYYNYCIQYPQYCRLAYLGGLLVGGITARIETGEDGHKYLYLMTLSVLKPYRRYGIASQLLGYILDIASKNKELNKCCLHAKKEDKEANLFYKKRGFKEINIINNYYIFNYSSSSSSSSPLSPPLSPNAVYMQTKLPWIFAGAKEIYQSSFDITRHNLTH